MATDNNNSVMFVVGEASSDAHTALLLESLKEKRPDWQYFGMGGSALRAAGMDTVVDSEKSASVMGITEIVGSLRKLFRAMRVLELEATKRRPLAVVMVDFPDFNFRLARRLSKLGMPLIYFITPQVWAWRKKRVQLIKRYFKKVLPIFPFEQEFFLSHGIDAEFVGHPFADRKLVEFSRETFFTRLGISSKMPVIALLPGSRKAEVERLLPTMLEAFRRLQQARPGLQALIPVAPALSFSAVKAMAEGFSNVYLVPGEMEKVLAVSKLAIVASGTATVETALYKVPMVVVYRLSSFSYMIAKLLVRGVKHFAMVNLIAGKKIVPELLQNEVSAVRLANEIERLLGDPKLLEEQREALSKLRARLLPADTRKQTAAERAADAIISVIAGPQELMPPASQFRRKVA